MKAVLVGVVLGLGLLSLATTARGGAVGAEAQCTEGSQWHHQCNKCWCIEGLPACTKMGCAGGRFNIVDDSCKDGSRWLKDDCNWCSCIDGAAVCTHRACLPDWARGRSLEATDDEQAVTRSGGDAAAGRSSSAPVCEPATTNDRWRDGCNWCRCSETGVGMCTRRGCPQAIVQRLQGTKECEGSPRWRRDCNWCTCSDDGFADCTDDVCPSKPDLQPLPASTTSLRSGAAAAPAAGAGDTEATCRVTENGDRWREDCNWCRCLEGKSACTRRGCPPALRARLEGTQECEGEAQWKHGANWCTCSNERAVCTGRAQINREDYLQSNSIQDSAYEPECTDGSAWTESCNSCRCNNGASTCTRRGCLRVEADTCVEGSTWKTDACNWCTCSASGVPACTRRACVGDSTISARSSLAVSAAPVAATLSAIDEGASCIDGSRWKKDGCNWCSCVGGRGVCTRRACLPADESRTPSLQCVEGSSWSDGCNNCHCSNSLAVCTKRACVNKVTIPDRRGLAVAPDMSRPQVQDRPRGHAVAPDMSRPQVQDRPRGHAVAPDMSRPQVQERPRGQPVAPDMSRPQVQDRPRGKAVAPDMSRPQVQDRPRGQAVAPDMSRPQVQDRPRGQPVAPDMSRPQVQDRPRRPISIPRDDRDCVPGSRFSRDGCNWCECGNNGVAACTIMACFKKIGDDEKMCEEGSRWKQDCNWCNCVDGRGVCTELACLPAMLGLSPAPETEGQTKQEPELAPDAECSEGSRWREDCNWCSCQNGRGVCTRRACIPGRSSDADTEPQCVAGSRWKADCNWCQCSDTGIGLCTLKACVPSRASTTAAASDPQPIAVAGTGRSLSGGSSTLRGECKPGSVFRQRCNRCRCSDQGLKLCTKRLCNPRADYSSEPQCEGDAVFKDEQNCNWCHCHNGIAACTLKLCFDVTHRPRALGGGSARSLSAAADDSTQQTAQVPEGATEECTEGTSWVEDCNSCQCRNGLKTCTRRLCLTQQVRPQASDDAAAAADAAAEPDDTSRCQKPVDSGPCFASFRMFRFNPDTNRCEAFLYGGCAGNDNRFATPELCQQACGGAAPVLDTTCDRTRCPEMRELDYYSAKGCTPVYDAGRCCATSFFCTETRSEIASPSQCLYQGTVYNTGDSVPVLDNCSRCRCRVGRIHCASIECPSLFRGHQPGCRGLYRPGECCEYDQECDAPPNPLEPSSPAVTRDAVSCEAEGKSYREADQMYFDHSPCQKCVCGPDYTGPFGAGCQKINCGFDFRYQDRIDDGCVPLFYEESCCPIGFICPGDTEIAEDQSQANPDGVTENVCTFNGTTVAVGRELATTEENKKCSCKTPPDVTCVQTDD